MRTIISSTVNISVKSIEKIDDILFRVLAPSRLQVSMKAIEIQKMTTLFIMFLKQRPLTNENPFSESANF